MNFPQLTKCIHTRGPWEQMHDSSSTKQYYPILSLEYITHNSYEIEHVDELKHIKMY